jgi:hypothetical protein
MSTTSGLVPTDTRRSGRFRIAVLAALPLFGYLTYAAEFITGRPNPYWALALLGCASAAVILTVLLLTSRGWLSRLERHSVRLAAACLVLTAACSVAVSVLQARHFAAGLHAEDTAYYSQILWNTIQGGPFLGGNVQQERLYSPPATNDLAIHVSPFLLLVLLPLYALFPSFLTLLIARDLALVAAGWPLFLLLRDRVGPAAALAGPLVYLANPVVISQSTDAFYLVHFAPLPYFFALRAFLDARLRSFLLWSAAAMAVREDVAILVSGLGLLALVTRRPLAWILSGLGVPLSWWFLATSVVQPAFGGWQGSPFFSALSGGASGPFGAYLTLVFSPSWIIEALRAGGLESLYYQLRSVGFLALAGPEAVLTLPIAAANLFLGRVLALSPLSHYALLSTLALVGAAILITVRLARSSPAPSVLPIVLLILLPSAPLADGIKDSLDARLRSTTWNDASVLREALALIPADASVAAPDYLLPALSYRPRLYFVTYLRPPAEGRHAEPAPQSHPARRYFLTYPPVQPAFIFVDFDLDRVIRQPELRRRYRLLLEYLTASGHYEIVWQHGPYRLFRFRSADTRAREWPCAIECQTLVCEHLGPGSSRM